MDFTIFRLQGEYFLFASPVTNQRFIIAQAPAFFLFSQLKPQTY